MEHKYIINIVHEQMVADELTREVRTGTTATSYGYENKQEAKKVYTTLIKKGFFEVYTTAGLVAFRIVSVELVEMEKYNQELALREGEEEMEKYIQEKSPKEEGTINDE